MKMNKNNYELLRETISAEAANRAAAAYMKALPDELEYLEEFMVELDKTNGDLAPIGYQTHEPVNLQQFLHDDYYMGGAFPEIFPEVEKAVTEILEGGFVQALCMGAIGAAKTTVAQIVQARVLYLLSCEKFPQAKYGQLPHSELVIAILNRTKELSLLVTYAGFLRVIEKVPYFIHQFPFDPDIRSRLVFPRNISVHPTSATAENILGMAVISGIADEMNFQAKLEKSKKSYEGGSFDQARRIYTALIRRQKSRFQKLGQLPGCMCLVSSANYAGDFTDVMKQEVLAENDGSTYIYEKAQWEVLPSDRYSGQKFKVEVGNLRYPSRILRDNDIPKPELKVLEVPIENYKDFRDDISGAMKDIAGIVTSVQRSYFYDRAKIWNMSDQYVKNYGFPLFEGLESFDFSTGMPIMPDDFEIPSKERPRAIHIDLAQGGRGDKCGFAMGFVSDVEIIRPKVGRITSVSEEAPVVVFDMLLQITSRSNEEIEFSDIREFIYFLSDYGYNIRWVSFDGFQSVDSRQLLKRAGYQTEKVSVEGLEAYEALRTAIWQDRIQAPEHKICFNELAFLEENREKQKIDHPANKSKDVSDAMAGVYQNLVSKRASWRINVPMVDIQGNDGVVRTVAAPTTQRLQQRRDIKRREIVRK